MMGEVLRTNVKEKKKSKYLGRDHFYHYIQNKQMKLKSSEKRNMKRQVLKELDISSCNSITNSSVQRITEVFKDLKILKIGENSLLDDESMKSIARSLKKLHTLDISSCPSITYAGLYTVSKHCSELQHISIGSTFHPPQILKYLQSKGLKITATTKQNVDITKKTEPAHLEPYTVLGQEMDVDLGQDMDGWMGLDGW